MESYKNLKYSDKIIKNNPSFYYSTFQVDEIGDTFLNYKGWNRGHVLINGNNIGRFWEVGPQFTLYVQAPLLHKGSNEIVLFDQIGAPDDPTIEFQTTPILR